MSFKHMILTLLFLVVSTRCGKSKDTVIGRYLVSNLPTENVLCSGCQRKAPLVWPVFSQFCIRTSNQHEISIIDGAHDAILLLPGTKVICCFFGYTDTLKCDWLLHHNEKTFKLNTDSDNSLDYDNIFDVMEEERIPMLGNVSVSYSITSPAMLKAVRIKTPKRVFISKDYQVSLYVNGRKTEASDIELKICDELSCRTNVEGRIGNETIKVDIADKQFTVPVKYSKIFQAFHKNQKYHYKKLRTSCVASWRLPPKIHSYRKLVSVGEVSDLLLIKKKMEIRFRSKKETYKINDDLYCYITAYEQSQVYEAKSWLKVGRSLKTTTGRLSGRRLTFSLRLQKPLQGNLTAECHGIVACRGQRLIKGAKIFQYTEKKNIFVFDPKLCDREPGTIEITPKKGPFITGQKLTCKASNCGTWKYAIILEREGHPPIKEYSDSFLIKSEFLGGRYSITCSVMSIHKAYVWKSDVMTATLFVPVQSITTDKDKVTLEEGDSLKCLANGYPTPTVKWMSVATDITSATKFRLNFYVNDSSTLTVRKNALIGSVVIICTSVNTIGNVNFDKRQQFTFYIQHKKEDENNTWIIFLYILFIFSMYSCIFFTRRKTRIRRGLLKSKKRY